jgi:hypothetical protein
LHAPLEKRNKTENLIGQKMGEVATPPSRESMKGIHVRRSFLIDGTAVVSRGIVVGLDPG